MDLNFNFDGLTRLKDWWRIVRDNFVKVKEAHDSVSESLYSERNARINGDNALQSQVTIHKADRASSSLYGHVILSDSVSSTSGASGAAAATPAAVKQAYDKAAAAQYKIDAEENKRQQVDADLQSQINDMVMQDNALDLYGETVVTHTAEMDIDWLESEYSTGLQQVGTMPLVTVDLSAVFNDYALFVDDVQTFNSALPTVGWSNDFSLSIGEGDNQYIRMYWNVKTKKSWLDAATEALDVGAYENGIWIFEIGVASASFYFAEDGSGTYQASVSFTFYSNSMGHYTPEAVYDGIRGITQLKGGSSFLDAINANTNDIQELNSKSAMTIDSVLSASSENPVQNKTVKAAFDKVEAKILTLDANTANGGAWYMGTSMNGTSITTGAYSYSSCPLVRVGDCYLNTVYGYVYQCTTAGEGSAAKWTYKGSIKGVAGAAGSAGQRGSTWSCGTAISGTSATANYTYSGANALVGDYYLNTSTGGVYRCVTAGSGTTAKWRYQGCIKGPQGDAAAIDTSLHILSVHPVQNKVITQEMTDRETLSVELACAFLTGQSTAVKNKAKKILKNSIDNAYYPSASNLILVMESYAQGLQDGSYDYPNNKVLFISGVGEEFDTIKDNDGSSWNLHNADGTAQTAGTGGDCIIKFDKPIGGKTSKCYLLFEW